MFEGRWSGGIGLVGVLLMGAVGCGNERPLGEEPTGQAEVALTNVPKDVRCARLTVRGPKRTDIRKFSLKPGQKAVFRVSGLPVGDDGFQADAFPVSCDSLHSGVQPTWYSEEKVERVRAGVFTHVDLKMIHNGQASVGLDFDDDNGPSGSEPPPLEGGATSSLDSFAVATGCGVAGKAIFSAGDSANNKPGSSDPYRMVGAPAGLGAIDGGDGTFTLLVNHDLAAQAGIERAHKATGSFVSKWTIRREDLAVLRGDDLIQQVLLFDPETGAYFAPRSGVAFNHLSSGNLPEGSAVLDPSSGLGFDGNLYFNGEDAGPEGRAFAHGLDGLSYELPRIGKASWDGVLPNPGSGEVTVVAAVDDSPGGQVYFYVGKKTASGSPIDRAGLTNGELYGLQVVNGTVEDPEKGIEDGPFELVPFGNVDTWSGERLEEASLKNEITQLQRPANGAWDPNNPNDFYFVTTAAFEQRSRLWRVHFNDVRSPGQGGRFDMLLDGSEGHHSLDSLTVDRRGHVYLLEDPGANDHLARVFRYDIGVDLLSEIAELSPDLFSPGSNQFLTNDEEASGIFDAADLLGPGALLVNMQVHRQVDDRELVEAGQLVVIYDAAELDGIMGTLATYTVECTGTIGPESFFIDDTGLLAPAFQGCSVEDVLEPGTVRTDKFQSLRSILSLQVPREGLPKEFPTFQGCIANRWSQWLKTLPKVECPRWREVETLRTSAEELAKSLPELDEEVGSEVPNPPTLEPFKVGRRFEIGFDGDPPDQACRERGEAGCAALCAGAFPGFVTAFDKDQVLTDPPAWLEDQTYAEDILDPYLLIESYYHPMSYQIPVALVGDWHRAAPCGEDGGLIPACNNLVDGQMTCTENGLCASERCSYKVGILHRRTRMKLNCLPPLGDDPDDPDKIDPATCVSTCLP